MYDIVIETEISAAHQLREYCGKCENLHGHNWKVRLEVSCEILDKLGMGIDFTDLKKVLNEVLARYDHAMLNDLEAFQKINPTSENLANVIYQQCVHAIKTYPVKMKSVSVWESTKAFVRYYE
ncbi:6-carboxytetrahydropterin synthase QueD [bacterium]|nr:6-carboxytetrahydropterin synthase QueD [bacterium]